MAVVNTPAPVFQAGQILTATQANALSSLLNGMQAAWTDYTPQLQGSTNPTLGTSGQVQAGRYMQIGKTILGEVLMKFGTAGVALGSGSYLFGLPVAAATQLGAYQAVVGPFWAYQSSTSNNYVGVVTLSTSTLAVARIHGTAGNLTSAAPVTWAAGDTFRYEFCYEAA